MSTTLFDLSNKVALITGATHGLGMAMATGLGKAGAKIVINGRSSQQKLDEAVSHSMLDMELSDWNEVINTDLTSVFLMSKAIVSRMIERNSGGKIINICSMMSELGRNSVGAYAAAKGGLKMLTRNMATEWAKHNIQVNGIGPGYFATSQTAPIRVDGNPMNEFIISRTPAGKWGDPDDLQGAAIFLASQASDFVTGQVVYVDGGILATIGKPANED